MQLPPNVSDTRDLITVPHPFIFPSMIETASWFQFEFFSHVFHVFPYYCYFQTMILQREYVGRFGNSRIRETKGFY